MIWTGTKEQFHQFYSTLNNCHHSIKFDHEISPDEVNFLDTTVYVDTNGTIQTKLYTKPTDRHNYLHRRSEHPLPLKNNLAYIAKLYASDESAQTRDIIGKGAQNLLIISSQEAINWRTSKARS